MGMNSHKKVRGVIQGINLMGGRGIMRTLDLRVAGEEEIKIFYGDGNELKYAFSSNGYDEEAYKFKVNDNVELELDDDGNILRIRHARRKIYSIVLEYCGGCPNCVERQSENWINFGGMILHENYMICSAVKEKTTTMESPVPEWCPLSDIE